MAGCSLVLVSEVAVQAITSLNGTLAVHCRLNQSIYSRLAMADY
jgi:hypothetical protein